MQYQGKEIHYTVTIEDEQWVIHQDLDAMFSIGEEVYIHLKKSQTRAEEKQLYFV